jgi:MoaA/NifB/PqqE/SkfB family radical SAM enzyme
MYKINDLTTAGKAIIKVKFGKNTPLRVTHIITNCCNLRCKYCYAESFVKEQEMNTEEILAMMSEFKKAGTKIWKIGGGEPLLKKDIKRIIEHGKELGFIINIDTNGTLVDKNIEILKNVDNIQISIDGPEEIHDTIRGKGVFSKCMNSIDKLHEIGKVPLINCVLSKHNLDHIEYLVQLAKEKKTFINFQPVVPVTKEAQEELSKELIEKKVFERILELKKSNNHIASSNSSLIKFQEYYSNKIQKYQRNCLAGRIYCIISPQGKIARCIEELGSKTIDGKKEGFINSFNKLSKDYSCDCTFCCYHDLSRVYNLNPKENLKAAYNIFTKKWVYN